MNQTLLHHDADLLRERRAAYRPRLHLDRGRRDGAVEAAGRVRRVLPDRHRRARPEGREGRGATPGWTRKPSPTGSRRIFATWRTRWACRSTTTSAPPRSGTRCPAPNCGGGSRRAGNIYLGHYEGWYAVRDEAFYDEDELTTRPDGSKVAPSGAPVEWVREPSYFFRLSAWQDRLLKLYEEQSGFHPAGGRRNEVLSFVRGGLRDLSISRTSFSWGIPVPGAPDHVMYVWLDALNNYVTACGFPDETAPRWHYWPADVHFVGKDILRFHAVYWPAFLMAAGLPVPKRVTSQRLVDGRRREDEQVARQRHRATRAGGGLRTGPGALLPAARETVRRRRHTVSTRR